MTTIYTEILKTTSNYIILALMECGLTYKNLYIKDFKVSSKKYGFIKNGITMKVISDYLVKNNIDKTFDDVYDGITADDLFEYQRWSTYYNYLLSVFYKEKIRTMEKFINLKFTKKINLSV
jgi:hypothetical protein